MSARSTSPNPPPEIPLEAVPMVCEGITLENLVLDQREGFLLSRLDGYTNVKQLCALSGLGEEETLALLRQLQAKQVVIWHQPKAPSRPAEKPAGTIPHRGTAPRAGERPESEEEFAALVDDLFRRREDLTLYELLGVESNATSKAIKKAYLQSSKSFHPDRYFRRADLEFRQKLQEIFKRIHQAYKELSDPVRRGEYEAALHKQDASKNPLDLNWEERREQEEAAKPAGPKLKLEFGKSALERQMEAKFKEMQEGAPGQGRYAQATRFYQGALIEIERKNLKAAEINLKLAMQFDPQNPAYRAEMERLKQLESSLQADIIFEQGVAAEGEGDPVKAIKLFGEALRIHPDRPDWLYRMARLVLDNQHNFERARALILKAIELRKGNPDYHFLLGQVYQGLGQRQPAVIQFEKTLELNPKHKSAAKELKALRKK